MCVWIRHGALGLLSMSSMLPSYRSGLISHTQDILLTESRYEIAIQTEWDHSRPKGSASCPLPFGSTLPPPRTAFKRPITTKPPPDRSDALWLPRTTTTTICTATTRSQMTHRGSKDADRQQCQSRDEAASHGPILLVAPSRSRDLFRRGGAAGRGSRHPGGALDQPLLHQTIPGAQCQVHGP